MFSNKQIWVKLFIRLSEIGWTRTHDNAVVADKESLEKVQDKQPKSPWLITSEFLLYLLSKVIAEANKCPLILGTVRLLSVQVILIVK